ncbi:MAG: HupE/UreJ family protein [Sphingobium sp.]
MTGNRSAIWLLWLFFAVMTCASAANAHEVRPAYLQIRETGFHVYDLMWKTPAQGDMRLALNLALPRDCRDIHPPRIAISNGAVIEFRRLTCMRGLPGQSIGIANLAATLTDAIIRFEPLSGSPKTLRATGATPEFVVPVRQSVAALAQSYFRLGVDHILTGYDHLLFLLCLIMICGTARRVVGAVTIFTLAHSITLAATTMGWIRLGTAPVEAAIALSIMFLAAEIVKQRKGKVSITTQWPWIASFGFGLLHGFGFASALRTVGLPDDAIPLALLCFNLGVEAGQIIFVVAIVTIVALARRWMPASLRLAKPLPPVVGTLAAFWFIERSIALIR